LATVLSVLRSNERANLDGRPAHVVDELLHLGGIGSHIDGQLRRVDYAEIAGEDCPNGCGRHRLVTGDTHDQDLDGVIEAVAGVLAVLVRRSAVGRGGLSGAAAAVDVSASGAEVMVALLGVLIFGTARAELLTVTGAETTGPLLLPPPVVGGGAAQAAAARTVARYT